MQFHVRVKGVYSKFGSARDLVQIRSVVLREKSPFFFSRKKIKPEIRPAAIDMHVAARAIGPDEKTRPCVLVSVREHSLEIIASKIPGLCSSVVGGSSEWPMVRMWGGGGGGVSRGEEEVAWQLGGHTVCVCACVPLCLHVGKGKDLP